TVELDDSSITLPEKYIDSPLIYNYGEPVIYTEEIKLTDEQKVLPIEEIYTVMRDYCNSLYDTYNIDKPVVNYKVDFVELSKTEQYKDLAILEQLDLYDVVTVNVSHLDINVKARVIKYKYDSLKERYESIELGDFSSVSSYKTDSIVKRLQSGIKASQSAAEYATNVITGNKGGYVVMRRYPDGKPYELLVMDTEDINTTQNLFRLNNSGLGFSRTGYNGTYGTAMTIDGHIVADYIDTGTLTSILLRSSNYVANSAGTKINLADGTIDAKNFKVDANGNIIANNAILNNGFFSGNLSGVTGTFSGSLNASSGTFLGQIIGGSMNINNKFIVDSSGNLTANNATLINGIFSGSITSNSAYITGGAFNVNASSQNDARIKLTYGNFNSSLSPYSLLINGSTAAQNTEIRPGNIFVGEITSVLHTEISYGGITTPSLAVGGYDVITEGNISNQSVSYASSAGSSSSCSTGYLTLSNGTLVAPSGSLWIGQNTVKANTIEQLSSEIFKNNINYYSGIALDLICNTPIKTYNYKTEAEGNKPHLGMIVEESPSEIISESGESLDIGAMTAMAWKAIQELNQIIDSQDDKIEKLEQKLNKLEVE
ncbi:MAG: phage tail spike protein, partial [Mobilitalea sp.]